MVARKGEASNSTGPKHAILGKVSAYRTMSKILSASPVVRQSQCAGSLRGVMTGVSG